jgi:hypothetical protein
MSADCSSSSTAIECTDDENIDNYDTRMAQPSGAMCCLCSEEFSNQEYWDAVSYFVNEAKTVKAHGKCMFRVGGDKMYLKSLLELKSLTGDFGLASDKMGEFMANAIAQIQQDCLRQTGSRSMLWLTEHERSREKFIALFRIVFICANADDISAYALARLGKIHKSAFEAPSTAYSIVYSSVLNFNAKKRRNIAYLAAVMTLCRSSRQVLEQIWRESACTYYGKTFDREPIT